MNAITAHELTKRYGRAVAVDSLSFEIERGEIVGFLGPNGAGKTTTLRMLAGLIRPSGGEGRVLGERVPGAGLLRVGTMIEEPSFYPYLSGRANLRHAALLHGGVPDARIDEVLRFASMDAAADKKVSAYSQGMRQRLGLARALLPSPDVLLLDEPTNGLDPVGIAEFRESLREVARTGVTILVSSHILAELEKLVERVLVLERGVLRYDGPLTALLHRVDVDLVTLRIEATDAAALVEALEALGLPAIRVGSGAVVETSAPSEEARTLLRRLAERGVDVLEARRASEDLEGAYLRLLKEDGRPS